MVTKLSHARLYDMIHLAGRRNFRGNPTILAQAPIPTIEPVEGVQLLADEVLRHRKDPFRRSCLFPSASLKGARREKPPGFLPEGPVGSGKSRW